MPQVFVLSASLAVSGCASAESIPLDRKSIKKIPVSSIEVPKQSDEGFSKLPSGLLVEVVDELGKPVAGATVQALIVEKGNENLGGMTFVLQDGSKQEFASDEDGEENGSILFTGKRWEAFGKAGNIVQLTVEAKGMVSRKKEIQLKKGRSLTAAKLNFPLKVSARSKGVSLKINNELIKDGGAGDVDGLENAQIYVKLPLEFLRKDGKTASVQPKGASKAFSLSLPTSPYGWVISEESGAFKVQTQKPNEDN